MRGADRVLETAVDGRVVGAALGDLAGRLGERAPAGVAELHRDDRRAARAVLEVLLRVLDLVAGEDRVVLDHPPVVDDALLLLPFAFVHGADDDDALGHLEDLGLVGERRLLVREGLLEIRARPGRHAVEQRLVGVLVERVEEPGVRVVVVDDRRALGRPLHGVVEPADRLLAAVDLLRVVLAVLVEDVGFPVVEVQLRRGADDVRRPVRVGDARQGHLDLVAARALQLGLGDAERVDAAAHDVERAVERFRRDRRLLLRRLALVDELDAALEVETQFGLLGDDHHRRHGDEAEHREQDEEVATTIGHVR